MTTSKWFWLFFLTYIIIYVLNKTDYVFPDPIQFYLADLLAIPVVATLSKWLTSWVLQKPDFKLPDWQIIFLVVLFSIMFEVLLPLFMKRYTADIIDVLMYIIGGIFYWRVMSKNEK